MAGFIAPFLLYAAMLLLHALLPSRQVQGYVLDPQTGRPLNYRLNGLLTFFVVLALWFVADWLGWLKWDWLYLHRWSALAGACALGLGYTLIVVLPAPSTGKPLLVDLFLGRVENPQYLSGRVDAKMALYMLGAIMLMLNTLSFAAYHHEVFGNDANPGVYLHAALFAFFVIDYLFFERATSIPTIFSPKRWGSNSVGAVWSFIRIFIRSVSGVLHIWPNLQSLPS